jgi:hypothetical protein
MSDETIRPKLVAISSDQKDEEQVESQSANPFANLDALRNPQDYEEFLGGEAVSAFAARIEIELAVDRNASARPVKMMAPEKSLTVGRSAISSQRPALVTARARSLPPLTCSITAGDGMNRTCTCPPIRSVIAAPALR